MTIAPGSISGPCVEVAVPSGQPGLTVETDNVSINGLAVTGGQTGINVINESNAITLTQSWIGVKLDGNDGGNATGIFIDPNSNGALVGGSEAGRRNVISYNGVGLDIDGADQAVVRGDFLGVKPEGTAAAANGKNIEITDSTPADSKPKTTRSGSNCPPGRRPPTVTKAAT